LTTEEGGTATKAQVPGFRVAGKTGTAQKVDPVTGGYSVDKRVASFVGFVPADKPRLVALVTIDEPKGHVYGGLVAAPVFSRIASQSLQYMKASPTQPVNQKEPLPSVKQILAEFSVQAPAKRIATAANQPSSGGPQMPDFLGLSYRQVMEVMEDRGLNVSFKGHGQVVEQSLPSGVPIPYGAPVWVRLAPPG
jgi:cell division protein FtsI (penicillin-binding protein 3)